MEMGSKSTTLSTGQRLQGRVLVIDDELPNRIYLRKILETRGCEVQLAANGLSGLKVAREKQPDLVLVDIVMPEMDGYQVCRKIVEEKATSDIPVIMVTAKTRIEDLEKAFECGAVDYIRKPFNPRELIARVSTTLFLKHAQDELVHWRQHMSRQLRIAGVLQQNLLDLNPLFTRNMTYRKANRPCLNVGGDFFDVVTFRNGRHCVYMADVCGHGVGPAMITALFKAVIFELLKVYSEESPSYICNLIQQRFRQYISDPAIYATFFIGIYEPDCKHWRCLSCGHPPPILMLPPDICKTALFMEGGGMPIGPVFGDEAPYTEEDEVCVPVSEGAVFFLYTDGLIEARKNVIGEECGIEGLTEALCRVMKQDCGGDWANAVLDDLAKHGYQLGEDDCSAIAIRMLPDDALILDVTRPLKMENVTEIATRVEALILQHGWTGEAAAAIQLLVMEHCFNVLEHSRLAADAPVTIRVWLYDDICRLYFEDTGKEWDSSYHFDQARLPPEDFDGGRGLMILKTIADSLDVFRRNAVNVASYVVRKDYATTHAVATMEE
jgi:CheY-like chemotaxis protein/anti-sigma regulatory factor (Ser/Thr protein kinase)